MGSLDRIKKTIDESINLKKDMLINEKLLEEIILVIDHIVTALRRGNRVIFAGNGGSAADAQHLAAEFVSRYKFDRPGLPALSLSTDTSMLTAIGNDYGFEKVFSRQIEAQARRGDIFLGITTSGKSKNILSAFNTCKELNIRSIALCGQGGDLENKVDHILRVPSFDTPRIQECHILIGHMICEEAESTFFPRLKSSRYEQ